MDVLFPRIGEIIGGSQREESYEKLLSRIEELHIPMKDMWWYLDTVGSVRHPTRASASGSSVWYCSLPV